MQEGPDGNTDSKPTYWFWHPTRGDPGAASATTPCAFNIRYERTQKNPRAARFP